MGVIHLFAADEESVRQVEDAITRLVRLAPTPAHIAGLFSEWNVSGKRGDTLWCPLRQYLTIVTGYFPMLVAPTQTYVSFSDDFRGYVDHPDAVAQFVEAFDGRAYPNLDLEVIWREHSLPRQRRPGLTEYAAMLACLTEAELTAMTKKVDKQLQLI